MLVVQKYGGSSVATPERIRRVAQRVVETQKKGYRVVVVVSAMGDTTDELIKLARQVTESPPEREMDMLLSTGEQISISLLAMAVGSMGVPAVSLTGAQAGIHTDGAHSRARILDVETGRVYQELAAGKVVVVAGFQGFTAYGDITTLGRGGSDTTAVALAAALGADVCEIYTDVDGVYTADPRLVSQARKLPLVSYAEMLELARLGAAVLHYRSVECARHYGITLHVRSSFNNHPGTLVKDEGAGDRPVVTGIAHDTSVAQVKLVDSPGFPGAGWQTLQALADAQIGTDMIIRNDLPGGTAETVFTIPGSDLRKAAAVINRQVKESGTAGCIVEEKVAKISVVGAGMVVAPGVVARMYEALAAEDINPGLVCASDIRISFVVREQDAARAARAIHAAFGLSGTEKHAATA